MLLPDDDEERRPVPNNRKEVREDRLGREVFAAGDTSDDGRKKRPLRARHNGEGASERQDGEPRRVRVGDVRAWRKSRNLPKPSPRENVCAR